MSHPSMEAKQVKEVKNGRRKTHLEGHAERMKKFTKCDGLEKDLEKFVPRESKLLADDVMKERIAEDDRALLECATIWGRDISTEDQTFGFLRDIEAASSRATNSGAHPFALPLPTPQTSSSLGDNTNNEKRPGDETVLSGSKRIKSVTGLRDLSTKEMDKKPGLVKKSQPGRRQTDADSGGYSIGQDKELSSVFASTMLLQGGNGWSGAIPSVQGARPAQVFPSVPTPMQGFGQLGPGTLGSHFNPGGMSFGSPSLLGSYGNQRADAYRGVGDEGMRSSVPPWTSTPGMPSKPAPARISTPNTTSRRTPRRNTPLAASTEGSSDSSLPKAERTPLRLWVPNQEAEDAEDGGCWKTKDDVPPELYDFLDDALYSKLNTETKIGEWTKLQPSFDKSCVLSVCVGRNKKNFDSPTQLEACKVCASAKKNSRPCGRLEVGFVAILPLPPNEREGKTWNDRGFWVNRA